MHRPSSEIDSLPVPGFARLREDGIDLLVRVTPRASESRFGGLRPDGRLCVRLRALPAEGQANAALVKLVALAFDLPRLSVRLVAGAASREKTLRLAGDPSSLATKAADIAR